MKFSTSFNRSVQPRKQRLYVYNAPLHTKAKFLRAPLSEDLQKTHNVSSARVRVGDKVKIARGQFTGTIGSVQKVDVKESRIYVESAQLTKKDGSKVSYPIHASKVVIVEAKADKVRFAPAKSAESKSTESKKTKQPAKKQ
jgi:large subunit ribosomal protein L24